MAGFIKFPKYLFDIPELWESKNDYLRMIMYLFKRADRSRVKGQFTTTGDMLAETWGYSRQSVHKFLKKFEQWGILSHHGTSQYTLIIMHYDRYGKGSLQQDCQSTQEIDSDFEDLSLQPSLQPSLHFNKDYNKTIKTDNNLTHTCACEDEKFFARMKQAFTAWQADTCRCLKIDQAALARLIDEFETECKAKNACHKHWNDITSHFVDWGRRQVEKQQKQESYGNNNRTSNRGAYEPTGLEDYSGERL